MVSDIAYSNSNSNVFLNSVKYLKPIGYGATGISVLSDVLLIIDGQQSLTETGINTSATMISMAVGRWPGFVIQENYQASKSIYEHH